MVSGIDDIKLTSETRNSKSVRSGALNHQAENTEPNITKATNEKSNSLSMSPHPQQMEIGDEKDKNTIKIQSIESSVSDTIVKGPEQDNVKGSNCSAAVADGKASLPVVNNSDIANGSERIESGKLMPALSIGVKRKRANSVDMRPPNAPRKKKLQLQQAPALVTLEKQTLSEISPFAGEYSNTNGTGAGRGLGTSSNTSTGPTQNANKCASQARRLPPMKIESVFSCKVIYKIAISMLIE